MLNLKIFRDTQKGLPDILNYALCVAPGIILNKDGSLSASFEYRSPDIFSATENERNYVASQINAVLSKFGNGWCFHIDTLRKPLSEYTTENEVNFPNPITKLIDEERKSFFLHENLQFETVNIITLTYLPPTKNKGKLADLMFDEDVEFKKNYGDKVLDFFKTKIQEFESLSSNVIKIRFLTVKEKEDEYSNIYYEDEFLKHINSCLTGKNHTIVHPKINMYLDSYIGAYNLYTGVIPKIDNKYISVIAISGFPTQSYPNILDSLNLLNLEYRWNTRYISLDYLEALSKLEKMQKKWKQKIRGFVSQVFNPNSTNIDEHASIMTNEVGNAINEVKSQIVTYGYYTSNIVVMNENRETLDEQTKEVVRIIEGLGFSARIETINAVESFLGTLPGHAIPNIRNILISSFNLTHLMPLSTMWTGDKYCSNDKYPPYSPPFVYTLSNGNTPFRLNLHVDDVGHTAIFGPTGAGKSTLLALLVAQHQKYHNAKIFAFDKGNSLLALTKGAGGNHFDIAGDENKLAFAPFSTIKTKTDKDWIENYVLTLLELQNHRTTAHQKELIHNSINLHIQNNSTTLTEFISNIQDNEIRQVLNHYSLSGSMGHLLDAKEDNIKLSSFCTFETNNLMSLKTEDAVPVLLYIFRMIEKALDGSPTMIILDEAWLLFIHPVFREMIRKWLKELRKSNAFVVFATQSLSDAVNSGLIDVIQESCPTKIFLPNHEGFNKGTSSIPGPYDFYKRFGLNDREIEIIVNAKRKREYYYCSPNGTRLFNTVLGNFTLAWCGASSKEDIALINDLSKENNWIEKYLKTKNINEVYIKKYISLKDEYEKNIK